MNIEVSDSGQEQTKQDTGITAELQMIQNELTGALIGLACTCMTNVKTEDTDRLIAEGLELTREPDRFGNGKLRQMTERIRREKDLVAPGCAACAERCANTADYDMNKIASDGQEIQNLKLQILSGIREIASGISHSEVPDEVHDKVSGFLQRALFVLAQDWEEEQLRQVVCETEKMKSICSQFTEHTGMEETVALP